jgi:glycosyltransferase involved in cell wall biosynthesis
MNLDSQIQIQNPLSMTVWPASSVCLVGPLPPPSGGMAEQTAQLARLLSNDGVQVNVVQVNVPYPNNWLGKIRGLRAIIRLIPYLLRLWQAIGNASIVHVMANSGWSWYLHAAPAILIAHFRKTPSIVNYRGGGAAEFLRKNNKFVLPTLRMTQALILPSNYLLTVFGKFGVTGKIVPNIVDLSRFTPAPKSSAPLSPHIIVTRNLETIYGIDVALKAFRIVLDHFPNARMTVAGTGDQTSNLQQVSQELNIADKVAFVGRLGREEIGALYNSADILLNASRIDNMPNSLLEALASGIPIVSTNAGGIPHMVQQGKTALLVDIDDFSAMAEATLTILKDAELRSKLIENGLAEAVKYSWESVSGCIAAAYADAAAQPRTRSICS